jgi:hypothetical protein
MQPRNTMSPIGVIDPPIARSTPRAAPALGDLEPGAEKLRGNGTNENTNGLLRQYWPKGADLRALTQTECDDVALRPNARPRMILEWKTPAQVLNARLVATTS